MEQEHTEASHDMLDISESTLIRADTGKRFLNYIIDLVIFYAILFGVGILIALSSPSVLEDLDSSTSGLGGIGDRIFSLFLYGLYMSIIETIFKGKSIGKLITGTRAVNYDGTPISAGTAFARGFSRAVPFCAFSALSTPCNPWQDRWTNTMVIDEKQSSIVPAQH